MRRTELLSLAASLAAPYRVRPPDAAVRGPAGVFAGVGDGQSVDFHDFRQYLPGDDLRRVDWRAYARTGQMHLKLFREEVSPVVELHLDTSASMAAYPGKEQAALFLAAFLRAAALAAEARPVLCRDGKRFAGGEFEPALAATEFAGAAGGSAAAAGRGRPLRFFLSDCLFEDGVLPLFRNHAADALSFCPVLILSQSEREPPWRGFHRLHDVELPGAGLDLALDESAVSGYRSRLKKHLDGVADAARRHGAGLVAVDVPDGELGREDCGTLVRRLAAERAVTAR